MSDRAPLPNDRVPSPEGERADGPVASSPRSPSENATSESPRVRLVGLWRGREINTRAQLHLDAHALHMASETGPSFAITLNSLDGYQLSPSHAVLYVHGGDVLDVSWLDEHARLALRQALDAACAMPELTRSLRAFGNPPTEAEAAHDRWFAPLLTMRRAVVGVSDPLQQLALFDVDRLAEELTRALTELAAQRTGGDPARTRALEAMFEEHTEAVRESLGRTALAATTLEGSAPDSRIADWRRWVDCLREVYERADAAWPDLAAAYRSGP